MWSRLFTELFPGETSNSRRRRHFRDFEVETFLDVPRKSRRPGGSGVRGEMKVAPVATRSARTAAASTEDSARHSRAQTEEEPAAAADCTLLLAARARRGRLAPVATACQLTRPHLRRAADRPTGRPAAAVTLSVVRRAQFTLSFIHPLRAKTLQMPCPRVRAEE